MRILLLLAFVLAPVAAPALEADEMFVDPALEGRARDLGRQLRCVKCRNQSIFDSNAGIAKDLRVVVRERIVAGDTDAEVLDFVQSRYGDYVLLKPRVTGETLILWGTPFALTFLGGLAMAGYLRSRTARPEAETLNPDDRRAAHALLQKEACE